MWMMVLPQLLTFLLILLVVGIGSHLMSLPAAFATTLTGSAAAMGLIFYPGVWNKKTSAVHTAAFAIHGFPP
jgi:hypothetical protein